MNERIIALKAEAYDLIVQIQNANLEVQRIQQNLLQLNQIIEREINNEKNNVHQGKISTSTEQDKTN
jgi:hypothetical protein